MGYRDFARLLSRHCCAGALLLFGTSTNGAAQVSFSPPGCDYSIQIPRTTTLGQYSSANGACETHYAALSAHGESTELSIECTICSTYESSEINQDFAYKAHHDLADKSGWKIIAESFEDVEASKVAHLRASSKNDQYGIYLQTLFGEDSFLSIRLQSANDNFFEAFQQAKPILGSIRSATADSQK